MKLHNLGQMAWNHAVRSTSLAPSSSQRKAFSVSVHSCHLNHYLLGDVWGRFKDKEERWTRMNFEPWDLGFDLFYNTNDYYKLHKLLFLNFLNFLKPDKPESIEIFFPPVPTLPISDHHWAFHVLILWWLKANLGFPSHH